jgi:DNA-binding NtrC family response regulator
LATSSKQIRVLVVDDDRDTRDSLARLLSAHGMVVESCASAEDALDLLSRSDTDVIISDISMPGMSGIEFASQMRTMRPHTPIILLTGFAGVVDRAIAQGMMALLKPYEVSRLLSLIKDRLEGSRLLGDL